MGDSSEESALGEAVERPLDNQQCKSNGAKALKSVILVAVGVASVLSIIWICREPWLYKAPEAIVEEYRSGEIGKDALLELAKQQHKLIVGQVIIKSLGWGSYEKSRWYWFNRSGARAWTMRSKIDVDIDTSTLSEEAFDLVTEGEGTRLKIRLPCPEINKRQCDELQPNELIRVLSDGSLDSEEDNVVRDEAFAMIKECVRKTVEGNSEQIRQMARDSASEIFRNLYTSLGVTRVDVEWVPNGSK